MKKIITMVGTSIFRNYLDKKEDETLKNYLENLKDKPYKNYEQESNRIKYIKNAFKKWVESTPDKINISAEVKSIWKISQEIKEEIEIYFLTSDTILSNIAFEVIRETWDKFQDVNKIKFYPDDTNEAVVKGLQVKDRNQFVREGMVNLINKIDKISEKYWGNIIINLTAGYKATLPYLTILAQVNRCPIYYIFEDTDALIKIPYIPIDIKWNIFKKNEDFFFDLESDIKEIPQGKNLEDLGSLIERADNLIILNPLGIVLWENYKNSFYLFKISEICYEYINGHKDRKNIIEQSFIELHRRLKLNPDHPDLDHKLANVNIPSGFKVFKHKEDNLQVRILYKKEDYKTKYDSTDFRLFIGLIAIGTEVHNTESEYVQLFERNTQKVENFENYRVYRIEKQKEV